METPNTTYTKLFNLKIYRLRKFTTQSHHQFSDAFRDLSQFCVQTNGPALAKCKQLFNEYISYEKYLADLYETEFNYQEEEGEDAEDDGIDGEQRDEFNNQTIFHNRIFEIIDTLQKQVEETMPSDMRFAEFLDLIGDIYLDLKLPGKALDNYNSALNIRQENKYQSDIALAKSHFNMSAALNLSANLTKAEGHSLKYLKIMSQNIDIFGQP